MNSLVDGLNAATSEIVDFLLWPLAGYSDWLKLIWISVLSGIVFLLIYGAVSSQKRIKEIKRKIYAALFEVVLYRHDLKTSLRAQGRMFYCGLVYFLIAVPPILVLLVPCLLLLSQLNLRFAYRPLHSGEQVLLKAKVEDRRLLYRVELEVPQSVEASPALRIPETSEVMWRLQSKESKPAEFNLKLGDTGKSLKQPLALADGLKTIASESHRDWWWRILYPDVSLSPVSELLSAVSISYPEQQHSLFGLQMHWVIIFAIVSILSGIVASRIFAIEI